MSTPEYRVFHIDRSAPDLEVQASGYKTLRLKALEQSPTSFSSTFEIESQFPDSVWLSRLQDESKETFACVLVQSDKIEWVAQVSLRGPIPAHEFKLPPESGQAVTDSIEKQMKWQMLSLYTLPDHRGKGLGKKLCKEAMSYLSSRYQSAENPMAIILRIMIKPDNHAVIGMYKSLGFVQTGTCTLEEALKANGDASMLPEGELPAHYTVRGGIIMAVKF